MKSVKTKMTALVLCCVLFSSVAIGAASIVRARKTVAEDSVQIMNLLCENRTDELNGLLMRIEQSVDSLADYVTGDLMNTRRIKTEAGYAQQYADALMDTALSAGQRTEGALAVYLRFNPELAEPTAGFFCVRRSRSGVFRPVQPTDLSQYDPTDVEHVGWYHIPVERGQGTWMEPYYNDNIGVEMVSYVVPLYDGDTLLGVLGMDIDFSLLKRVVEHTDIYETGYVFLVDKDAKIVYHKTLETGIDLTRYNGGEFRVAAERVKNNAENGNLLVEYTYEGTGKRAAFRTLNNEMRVVLTAPAAEIDRQANQLVWQILLTIVVVAVAAVAFAVWYAVKLVRPLTELTGAAQKIADGDLSVTIAHRSNDEVGTLAESFRQTVAHLHKYISYINELAYRDALTGVKNKAAYQETVRRLENDTCMGRARYGVLVFDINDLKAVNDSLGHEHGDALIVACCRMICEVFKRSPVYRIGGDEFVALLEEWDYEKYPQLLEELEARIAAYNADEDNEVKVSIAHGMAVYTRSSDATYSDVFKRADNAMYHNKSEMKESGE